MERIYLRFPASLAVLALLSACTLTVTLDKNEDEEKDEQAVEEVMEEPAVPVEEQEIVEEPEAEAEPEVAEEEPAEEGAVEEEEALAPEPEPAAEEAAAPRVIQVTADNWVFSPNVITVKQGEKVTLSLTSLSGTHGFSVPGLGIDQPISPGQTVTVELPTDKVGTYDLLCSIACGTGHKDMTGKIVIE